MAQTATYSSTPGRFLFGGGGGVVAVNRVRPPTPITHSTLLGVWQALSRKESLLLAYLAVLQAATEAKRGLFPSPTACKKRNVWVTSCPRVTSHATRSSVCV